MAKLLILHISPISNRRTSGQLVAITPCMFICIVKLGACKIRILYSYTQVTPVCLCTWKYKWVYSIEKQTCLNNDIMLVDKFFWTH